MSNDIHKCFPCEDKTGLVLITGLVNNFGRIIKKHQIIKKVIFLSCSY